MSRRVYRDVYVVAKRVTATLDIRLRVNFTAVNVRGNRGGTKQIWMWKKSDG